MRSQLLAVIFITSLVSSCIAVEPGDSKVTDAKEKANEISNPESKKQELTDENSEIESVGEASNGTAEPIKDGSDKNVYTLFKDNQGMLKRALYVTLAITGILVLYFGIRIIRSRKRRVKKYGLLSQEHESLGMQHLDSDSDEDMTVYDARTNNM